MTTGAWVHADIFDPDPASDRAWKSDANQVVVAIDVVANYCLPTPCRPTVDGTIVVTVEPPAPVR